MQKARNESLRIFHNDLLEALTHVHPIVPLLFWSPVALILLYRSFAVLDMSPGAVVLMAPVALLAWTLTEYLAHRFIFHFEGRNHVTRFLVFLFHGVHHEAPQDKTRLVMPPAGGVLLMSLFWLFYRELIPAPWIEPFFAFFIFSYLGYDYIHYATHHFRMRNPIGAFLKRYHMEHHFKDSHAHFGVSSPLWDYVFQTYRCNRTREAPPLGG